MTIYVDKMTIYVDLLFILNFILDFIILLTINIVLKRNTKIYKIILGSVFGALTTFLIFLNINKLTMILIKIVTGTLMVIITFKYKSIKHTLNNLTYLYMISTILGGFLYYLKVEFTYINYILLIIICPIIIVVYIKQNKKYNNKYNYYYKVFIEINKYKNISINGYLDTGNKLKDPITNKNIVIINKDLITIKYPLYVPINSINNHTLIKCMKVDYIKINDIIFKNYLIGVMDNKINIDGIDCILHSSMLNSL